MIDLRGSGRQDWIVGVWIFFVAPVVGFLIGVAVPRRGVVVFGGLIVTAVAVSGWLVGWSGDSDTPALGGAIIFECAIALPFIGAAAFGVWARESKNLSGDRRGELLEVRLRSAEAADLHPASDD